MLECSHMKSTNQSQPDANFVTKEKKEKKEEWLRFKHWIDFTYACKGYPSKFMLGLVSMIAWLKVHTPKMSLMVAC